MAYFPFCIDLAGRTVLIAGGGKVALRKAEKLRPFGAKLKVVAPETDSGFDKLSGITLIHRRFEDSDLEGAFAVIAATDNRELNSRIYRLCKEQNKLLVNTVDDPENCGFIFPALVNKDGVTVSINTGGNAPAYAKHLRKQIEALLDEKEMQLFEALASARPEIHRLFKTDSRRAQAAAELIRLFYECDDAGDFDTTSSLERIRDNYESQDRDAQKQAGADTVGACG